MMWQEAQAVYKGPGVGSQQTIAHGPNLAHCLCCRTSELRWLLHFLMVGGKKQKNNILWYMKIIRSLNVSVINKVY